MTEKHQTAAAPTETPTDTPAETPAKVPAPAAGDPARIDYPLPSGKIASSLAKPKGKHMRMAGRVGQMHPDDQTWQNYCLVAETTLVDGQPITAHDLDDMDLGDVTAMVAGLMAISQGKSPASAA